MRLLVSLFLLFSLNGFASDNSDRVLDEYVFSPSESAIKDIDETLALAKAENKLAMIVLGAQWCHDSRGLSAKFSNAQMHALLKQHYKTLFVDVGFLEDKRHITQRFSYPGYFGTPTVLIVDPVSERLLNYESISKWQSADSVPSEEYIRYFSEYAEGEHLLESAQIKTPYLEQIQRFEQIQIQRLFEAYSKLGPLLKSYKEDTLESDDVFNDAWVEVRKFRSQLQQDLISLRQQARLQQASNQSTPLVLPEYAEFLHL
ncbi:thioredoxin family protein [Agaribacter marinus]|uniref:Thioredoxin-like n=1 Tax=Agaribacter marinus TaxID=1431249 RepID=A0AA37WJ36_9ALTE|nr:thioredoxin family protein [Agaribacter marinus]GLR69335.1 hypothetical protein GCM10007852_02430 [Agaribacter marinus]